MNRLALQTSFALQTSPTSAIAPSPPTGPASHPRRGQQLQPAARPPRGAWAYQATPPPAIIRNRAGRALPSASSTGKTWAQTGQQYLPQNSHTDVVLSIDTAGTITDRIRYTTYGEPQRYSLSDLAGRGASATAPDAAIDNNDYTAFINAFGASDPLADVNADGLVDADDYIIFINNFSAASDGPLGTGTVSTNLDSGFRRGYAGYEFDPVRGASYASVYHVRNRVYDAENGRWNKRDPLGYVDGMGLYEYCKSRSLNSRDAFGYEDDPLPGMYDGGINPPIRFIPVPPRKRRDSSNPGRLVPVDPRLPIDPCQVAQQHGLDARDGGGVVCYQGHTYGCNWSGYPNDSDIGACIIEHEFTHFDHATCDTTPANTVSRPSFKPSVSQGVGECDGYTTELNCLQGRRGAGPTNGSGPITDRIKQLCNIIRTRGWPCNPSVCQIVQH